MKVSPSAIAVSASFAILAASVLYVAEGVFSRFDRAAAMIERVPAALAQVKDSTDRLESLMDSIAARTAAARAALPAVGREIGESGAEMADVMRRHLALRDAMQGLENLGKNRPKNDVEGDGKGDPIPPTADALDRILSCWRAKRELVREGGALGMWCGYENIVEREPETEEELRNVLSASPKTPHSKRTQLINESMERLRGRVIGSADAKEGKDGSPLSGMKDMLQESVAEGIGYGQAARAEGGPK